MDDLTQLISDVGFPIVIALAVLFRLDVSLRRLEKKFDALISIFRSQAPQAPHS